MANLWTGEVISNNEYIDLATASGVTFENGKRYQIQFFNKGFIREGNIGEGFDVYEAKPFTLEYKGDTVYVCGTSKVKVNIAE